MAFLSGSNGAMPGQGKVKKVMGEYKEGKLHSGSKKGAVVHSRKQAIAIAMSEAGLSKHKDGSYRGKG